MNKKNLIIFFILIFITSAILASFFISTKSQTDTIYASKEFGQEDIEAYIISEIPKVTSMSESDNEIMPTPLDETFFQTNTPEYLEEEIYGSNSIAKITIETSKKTITFDVMDNVDEETLKHNLGHLPSSPLPGAEGTCVIMGHRDTQFAALQYCEVGNKIVLEINNIIYEYTVQRIEIIKKDGLLNFVAIEGINLVLVTCYPFVCVGHAPQKIIYNAKLYK